MDTTYEAHCERAEGDYLAADRADEAEALARKILALPLEKQLRLSVMVERPSLSLAELQAKIEVLLPPDAAFEVEVQAWKHARGSKSVEWSLWIDDVYARQVGFEKQLLMNADSAEALYTAFLERLNPKPQPLAASTVDSVDVGF